MQNVRVEIKDLIWLVVVDDSFINRETLRWSQIEYASIKIMWFL